MEIPHIYCTTGEACEILGYTDHPGNRVKVKKILIHRNADQFKLSGCKGRPRDLWVRAEIESFATTPRIEQLITKVRVKQA